MSKRYIYWFRNDLRLNDNEAFWNAVRDSDEIVPVYVFDPRRFRMKRLGFRKTGFNRAVQNHQAVSNLRQEILKRGGDLLIRIGEPEKIIADLANNYNVSEVRASKEITLEETNIEASLSKKLKGINVDISLIWMNTLIHPHDLPFYISRLPASYGKFARSVSRLPIRNPVPESPLKVFLDEEKMLTLPDFTELGFSGEESSNYDAKEINENKEAEIETLLSTGKAEVNEIVNWVSGGLISPRQAFHFTKNTALGEPLYARLLWRDYLQFVALKCGTRLFKPSGLIHQIDKAWGNDGEAFKKWTEGRTGNQEVDRYMIELRERGMLDLEEFRVVARYLVEELGINWTWGAAWFESRLKYYETVLTWGEWNYFAGVGLEEVIPQ